MRQGQQNKRLRGRNRKGPNPLSRSYESNGPDVKIRGTALHIAEKYSQLARDAQSSGDRVMEQRYLQHAEHYYRIVAAAQAQAAPAQQPNQPQQGSRDDDDGDEVAANERSNGVSPHFAGEGEQPSVGTGDPQPYVNGNGSGRDQDDSDSAAPAAADAETADREDDDSDGGNDGGSRPRRRRSNRGRPRRDGDDAGQVPAEAAGETLGDD